MTKLEKFKLEMMLTENHINEAMQWKTKANQTEYDLRQNVISLYSGCMPALEEETGKINLMFVDTRTRYNSESSKMQLRIASLSWILSKVVLRVSLLTKTN